jgi:methionine biosynthesis protein MetW
MRIDQKIIEDWIKPGARILDLGCGDGSLLEHLTKTKGARGYGLEISADGILSCVKKGINVIEQNLDDGLHNFADQSFDTVIMSQVLQTMHYPDKVLAEMMRVGCEAIVTFPNFGHWRARWHLAIGGKMPVSDLLPYEWYNTPNIHFCTFKDFEILCKNLRYQVIDRRVAAETAPGKWLYPLRPNLFGETAIYRIRR